MPQEDDRATHDLEIEVEGPRTLRPCDEIRLAATGMAGTGWSYEWHIHDAEGKPAGGRVIHERGQGKDVVYRLPEQPGLVNVKVVATRAASATQRSRASKPETYKRERDLFVQRADVLTGPISVDLQRAAIVDTFDLPLWAVIRASTDKLSFNNYQDWMDRLFCGDANRLRDVFGRYVRNSLPFPDIISYKALKFATEAFLLTNCGVAWAVGDVSEASEEGAPIAPTLARERFDRLDEYERDERMGLERGDTASRLWKQYLVPVPLNGHTDGAEIGADGDGTPLETLPYLALIRRNLPEWRIDVRAEAEEKIELCDTIMGRKFTSPCFLELLWSYWHEEGQLVQSMHAISMRFQNRSSGHRDPLATLALDPLRPLNNLLWGYVQDEQHRLTPNRRWNEYAYEYGLTSSGPAGSRVRSAETRSRFLEAFHTLLHRTSIFYKDDDDTTKIADPFPVLNALRDVHLLLAEGAHNQYGDLPWTARHEMLMQGWLLSRPELREFLPSRTMVAYPEEWMGRVDAMKKLQGWSDTSVRYFRDLGVFGEQIVLSIRFGNWSNIFDREQAGNWARYWRQEVQWYIHAYQSVTGVDLSADTADVRHAQLPPDRFTQPAFLLRDRFVEQRERLPRFALRDGRPRRGAHPALPPGHRADHEMQEAEEQPTQR